MNRNAAAPALSPFSYQHVPVPQPTRAAATSSAFSASAHPHEDWTKISDLAERRRIQNRIAQRNYRKKLKKRLEDLEKLERAASKSASPEQQPAQLNTKKSPKKKNARQQAARPSPIQVKRESSEVRTGSSDPQQMGFLPLPDDRMFSEQFTRQLSTSPPPPFTYPLASADPFGYPPFTTQFPYSTTMTAPCATEPHMYPYQQHPFAAPYPSPLQAVDHYPNTTSTKDQTMYATVKQEEQIYPADLASFSIGYAAFDSTLPPTPPLSETFEHPYSESPPESSTFPQTPAGYPSSPPVALA